MNIHNVDFADLTLEHRADGKSVYRYYASTGDDFIFVNVPAELTRGIPIAVFGGPGHNQMTKTPGTGEVRFYSQSAGDQGARKIGDPDDFGSARIDLGAGDRGVGGGASDYILHKSDYDRFGSADMMSFDIREDRLIAPGEDGFRVTAVDFLSIDRSDPLERTGIIRSVTIEFDSSNDLLDGATARLWLNSDREREPENLSLDWTGGTGAADRKLAAAQEFAEAGIDQWLFV